MSAAGREWIVPLRGEAPPDSPPLLCFPHAGGTPPVFHPLARRLSGAAVSAVQLPGRGARLAEPPPGSVDAVAAAVAAALGPDTDPRLVLYGHSFGAVVALEVARRLRELAGAGPRRLVVSGRMAPVHRPDRRRTGLSDDALTADLVRLGADPEPFRNPELRELVLPALRADFRLLEQWRHRPGRPLACPILAVAAAEDPEAPASAMAAWGRETTGPFRLVVLDGGHFLLDHQLPRLAALLSGELSGGTGS